MGRILRMIMDADSIIEGQNVENITTKYLTFLLGGEKYAFNLSFIQEVAQNIENIVKIPNSPVYLIGVVHLNDQVIPLVDLRIFYQLSTLSNQKPYIVVIIKLNDSLYGLIVDTILDIIDIQQSDIKPLNLSTIIPHYYIEGLATIENSTFIIFNLREFIQKELFI